MENKGNKLKLINLKKKRNKRKLNGEYVSTEIYLNILSKNKMQWIKFPNLSLKGPNYMLLIK